VSVRRRRRLSFLFPLAVAVLMGFLYYRPLSNYLETRTQLASRRAEVAGLRAERARLERRLARTTSLVVLAREARRIGYVKPEERLFIVKGLPAWRQAHAATVSDDGRP
jgi:cell division protein FtsB